MRQFLALGFLIFLGCATAKPSGFLDTYSSLTKGQYLEKVFLAPELASFKSTAVEVTEPQLLDRSVNEDFPGAEAQKFLKNSMEVNLRNESGFKVVDAGQGSLKLETAITKLDPGSQAMRWFASELGAGHSLVQVEGRLVDASSGKILLRFSDRRAGSANGGLDITGGNSKEMMRTDLDNIGKSVAETLRDVNATG